MPHWLPGVLARIKDLAASRRVRFTLKALRELALLEHGLDQDDACDVLIRLTASDSAGRLASKTTGEWMYLFKPKLVGTVLYVKVIVRNDCIVVSFHEDEPHGHEEENA
ncbi:MAG: type II toxin-antitoxin system MqsR family toxin [Proteobacteria bacterium]|nr:type II toxin-antitoxin system MqsR family toxin [Pseudomonadota bacterium]